MFQPVSDPLQDGLRFFRHLIPANPTTFLTVGLPMTGQDYGLTVFHTFNDSGLDPNSSPAVICPCVPKLEGNNRLHTFWFRLISTFSLLALTEFKRWFTYVSHTTEPSPAPTLVLVGQTVPHGAVLDSIESEYVVSAASHLTVTSDA